MSDDPATAAAVFSWQDGVRRLEALRGDEAHEAREAVIAATRDELQRRLGMAFTTADLAREYGGAATWFMPLAAEIAPRQPKAWDTSVVLDAAFARFQRRARDAHGGT